MKIEIKFGKDYTCWYLTPAIGIGNFSLSTIIGIELKVYKS
ncbi:hypothetical protein [uncultured phage cr1_1]|uniref:Uncharacterized protein n=1 Tax=uncultured phage cr1_1 TaxID=2772064 RepID=A0A7M1RWK1_9CAUD|nr:hypothetical protein KNV31_gp043 [uncultured phage cr1_1]QOR58494.1 hypothetical protein [uncultured phage cr1_1]